MNADKRGDGGQAKAWSELNLSPVSDDVLSKITTNSVQYFDAEIEFTNNTFGTNDPDVIL